MVIEYYKRKTILSHHDFQNFIIKLFDPDCIEIGLIVNVAPGAPGSGERRKEICLIQSIFKGQFWKMTPYVMNGTGLEWQIENAVLSILRMGRFGHCIMPARRVC